MIPTILGLEFSCEKFPSTNSPYIIKHRERRGAYAVLRISGCTLYSFAKTKGTIPCGRAACSSTDRTAMSVSSKPQQKCEICCIGIILGMLIGVIKWEELVEYNEGRLLFVILYQIFTCTIDT